MNVSPTVAPIELWSPQKQLPENIARALYDKFIFRDSYFCEKYKILRICGGVSKYHVNYVVRTQMVYSK